MGGQELSESLQIKNSRPWEILNRNDTLLPDKSKSSLSMSDNNNG